jgi:4-diphosphocytidyl-2-C-methyl-D-erythritol kinase
VVTIARAVAAQVPALCAIERTAVELFRGHRAWSAYAAMAIPPELLEVAVARGLVWVALEQDAPVGFVWLDDSMGEGAIDIAEIDVLPSHGRRGIRPGHVVRCAMERAVLCEARFRRGRQG